MLTRRWMAPRFHEAAVAQKAGGSCCIAPRLLQSWRQLQHKLSQAATPPLASCPGIRHRVQREQIVWQAAMLVGDIREPLPPWPRPAAVVEPAAAEQKERGCAR